MDEVPVVEFLGRRTGDSGTIKVPAARPAPPLYCLVASMDGQDFFVTPHQTLSAFQEAAATFRSVETAVTFGELFLLREFRPVEVGDVRVISVAPGAT